MSFPTPPLGATQCPTGSCAPRASVRTLFDHNGYVTANCLQLADFATDQPQTGSAQDASRQLVRAAAYRLSPTGQGSATLLFIQADEPVLLSSALDVLDAEHHVVGIGAGVEPSGAVLTRLERLRQAGMRLSLDEVCHRDDPRLKLLPMVQFLQLDTRALDPADIVTLHARATSCGVRTVLTHLPHMESVARWVVQGLTLFHSEGVMPHIDQGLPSLPPCQSGYARKTLEFATQGAAPQALATMIERDPALALRFVLIGRARAPGEMSPSRTLADLLQVMGCQRVCDWLSFIKDHESGSNADTCGWRFDSQRFERLIQALSHRAHSKPVALPDLALLLGYALEVQGASSQTAVRPRREPLVERALVDAVQGRSSFGPSLGVVVALGCTRRGRVSRRHHRPEPVCLA